MRRILDTNAYVAARRGSEAVADLIRRSEEAVLPVVVVAELMFGFRNGARYEANVRELEEFLDHPRVGFAAATWVTAERYGRIAGALRRKGRPIPSNDVWVAAHAMELGAELISYDKHFAEVDGLAWTMPSDAAPG